MKILKNWKKKRFSESRMRVIYAICFVLLGCFALTSCIIEEPDGKWDSMVWKAEEPVQKTDGIYTISASGSVITFSCGNYSSPWIENAESEGEWYFPPREENNYHTIKADWFNVEMRGNKLKVTFERNETPMERPLKLTVTAGDIFYTFNFKQFANR